MPKMLVEGAKYEGVNPLGSCEAGCVCLQHKCEIEYHWGYEGATGPEHWGEEFPVGELDDFNDDFHIIFLFRLATE